MPKSFTISKRGYAPEEVLAYITELEEVIEQFKSKEHYISTALVDSHIASQDILEEAEIHAFEIEKDALIQLERFREELDETKKRLGSFKNDYDTFVGNFRSSLEALELGEAATTLATLEKGLDQHMGKSAPTKNSSKRKKRRRKK